MRAILTQSGVHFLMVPRTVFLVSFLPAHSCISGEGTIVTHMTQIYSACCQTWYAVRLVYWDYILPSLLWKITESHYLSMYTFGITKPLSNTVLPPLHGSLSYKIVILLFFLNLPGFTHTDEEGSDKLKNFCNMFYTHVC